MWVRYRAMSMAAILCYLTHERAAMAKKKPRKTVEQRVVPRGLLRDVRKIIREAREGVARAVNTALVLLYWEVGNRIHQEILGESRVAYGEQIVAILSRQLSGAFLGRFIFAMARSTGPRRALLRPKCGPQRVGLGSKMGPNILMSCEVSAFGGLNWVKIADFGVLCKT